MKSAAAPGRLVVAVAAVSVCAGLLGGCATIPQDALVLSAESMQLRQLQSRRLDGIDEKLLLSASAGVLQDLGFNIDESETRLGVIVASKDRSAFNAGQLTAAIALALFGVDYAIDRTQKIRVSLVTRPALAGDGVARKDSQVIRITIQRMVWDTDNRLSRVDSIEEPQVYQEFFDRLSKSVFLEVQEVQ